MHSGDWQDSTPIQKKRRAQEEEKKKRAQEEDDKNRANQGSRKGSQVSTGHAGVDVGDWDDD
jgi:hypothetical protein